MNVSDLKPGDRHYMAYVGPPAQYDFMSATQFRLLCALGLRSNHYLLDFGCGSLRAGRLFICYLDKGRYFGIDPNRWLIEDAMANHFGQDLVSIKEPRFDYNEDFMVNFSVEFDFILAQSVFSHAGKDLITKAINNFKKVLKNSGIIAATFIEGNNDFDGSGWTYPGCVNYTIPTIMNMAEEAGLFITRIPWYHPRQTWFLLAKQKNNLPNNSMMRHLTGAVLFDPDLVDSWKRPSMPLSLIKKQGNNLMRTWRWAGQLIKK